MDWISLAIAIALLVVAVYSGISYFREKKAISRVFRGKR
ncbi:small membrane protein [Escherichia coli]